MVCPVLVAGIACELSAAVAQAVVFEIFPPFSRRNDKPVVYVMLDTVNQRSTYEALKKPEELKSRISSVLRLKMLRCAQA